MEKQVIVFYKERLKKPERRTLAVTKARKLEILEFEKENKFIGNIRDFFP